MLGAPNQLDQKLKSNWYALNINISKKYFNISKNTCCTCINKFMSINCLDLKEWFDIHVVK
jgi:hypothetical protein